MPNAFMKLAFTPNVRAMQERMGSREAYSQGEHLPVSPPALSEFETNFIAARDSFYLATVGQTGWPYIQHRGGPAGFLKVLDDLTIGFADYSGNRQYVSVGNLTGDDRVSLFLMDYAQQTRLKILGRARVVDEATNPELLTRLDDPHYRARVERGIVIQIEGFDWNCPKFITPRYTEDAIADRIAAALSSVQKSGQTVSGRGVASVEPLGQGEIDLVVAGVRQLTPRVRSFELRHAEHGELPLAGAGAHLEVPVRLDDGAVVLRQYSLAALSRTHAYEIAVLHEPDGRGASAAIHRNWRIGTRVRVARPINHFSLHADARPVVLIAGGIGITPIRAMAQALRTRGSDFSLHYSAATPADMAYREEVLDEFAGKVVTYFSRVPEAERLDIARVIDLAPDGAVFYVCGPTRLIEAVRKEAQRGGRPLDSVCVESFM